MIDREHDLPITKQAELLKISRGNPVPSATIVGFSVRNVDSRTFAARSAIAEAERGAAGSAGTTSQ